MECERKRAPTLNLVKLALSICCVASQLLYAAPPIEAYSRLPGLEFVRISPSGERLAMIGILGDKRRALITTTKGELLKAVEIGVAKISDVRWIGDEHVLVTTVSAVDGNRLFIFHDAYRFYTVLHIGLDDAPVWTVFQKSRRNWDPVEGYFGAAKKDGKWYGYFGGWPRETSVGSAEQSRKNLYRVELDTQKTILAAQGTQWDHDWVLSPDGGIIGHSEYLDQSKEWRLYAGEHDERLLTKRDSPTREVQLLSQGRTDGTLLIWDQTPDVDSIDEISLSNSHATRLFADQIVTELVNDVKTGLLIGALTANSPGAVFFDPALQDRYDSVRNAFPGSQIRLVSFSDNLNKIVVKTEGPRDSGTFRLVDMETDQATRVGNAYPDIKPADVGATKIITYHAGDGLMIEAVLTLPPGREPKSLPLIVIPRGDRSSDAPGFDWRAQAFALRGYAVLQPDYRGSGGYGFKFRRAGDGQWGKKMLTDISDGVADLAKQQVIDPKRVCIVGSLYGGYAALAGVTLQQGLYRCAVAISGYSNMESFSKWARLYYAGGDANPYAAHWLRITGADVEGFSMLRTISPVQFAARADAPILLIHAWGAEPPIEQSEEMAAALKRAGKPYEFLVLDKEVYFLSRDTTRTAMLKAAITFVEKYNPPR
jgi:dipeptidyl aminopeptidase/acylaminoacyl peptidase